MRLVLAFILSLLVSACDVEKHPTFFAVMVLEQDNNTAFDYSEKDIAKIQQKADAGDAVSQRLVGQFFMEGYKDISRDIMKSSKWLQKAAMQNDPPAQYMLAKVILMINSKSLKNRNNACLLTRAAFKAGYDKAQRGNAMCYLWGYGSGKNIPKGLDLLEAVAEQGDIRAQYLLGNFYNAGSDDFQSDPIKAAYWLEKAAKADDKDAQYELASLYFQGRGVGQDKLKSQEFLCKAALNDHPKLVDLKQSGECGGYSRSGL
ncbi:MAG: tetratricopeptide repeat protein [Pseudomonadota bacterium]